MWLRVEGESSRAIEYRIQSVQLAARSKKRPSRRELVLLEEKCVGISSERSRLRT